MKPFWSGRPPVDTPKDLLQALNAIVDALREPPPTPPSDPAIVLLQTNLDRLEAGFLNWKQEMTRLAARIEKQAWRKEQQDKELQEIPELPEDVDEVTLRLRERRNRAVSPSNAR